MKVEEERVRGNRSRGGKGEGEMEEWGEWGGE